MKKVISYTLLIVAGLVFSCRDESLDPLNMSTVKKGTLLALRGTQLNNIYVKGIPGAELFPKIATGSEVFAFDGEYLSGDPNSLSSFDIYVIRKPTSTTTSRELLMNVPFSQFKKDATYLGPWVSVSTTSSAILGKLGITFPLDATEINTLLTTYAFGVQMEVDLNLVDGTKVLAADLVAAGLYQSNQFYPAQKLNYAMTDYCTYSSTSWAGTYDASEARATVYGPYPTNFVVDGTNANKYFISNFWDCAAYGIISDYYLVFQASSNPATQIVTFPSQTTANGTLSGTGTYNQCLRTLSITTTWAYLNGPCTGGSGTDNFRYDFKHQ